MPEQEPGNKLTKEVKMYKADDLFAQLRDFMDNAPADECQQVWDVLSALRGPDFVGRELKEATTSVIRHKVFGMALSSARANVGAAAWPDSPDNQALRNKIAGLATCHTVHDRAATKEFTVYDPNINFHFMYHVFKAFQALKMDW